jgi:hypothetical protein
VLLLVAHVILGAPPAMCCWCGCTWRYLRGDASGNTSVGAAVSCWFIKDLVAALLLINLERILL